ncbi:equilibrative nucleoside transporter 1-like isoform X1 [Dysidea avara]|uniref:equilibrative nucleoside transporter 1-like isoform X1 n=1 Tax=Dysidea avara TaxID=196820 RepID=UPI003321CA30
MDTFESEDLRSVFMDSQGNEDDDEVKINTAAPRDRFKLIFWIMIIQGLGGLLPFNMFINAYEYFSYKFNGTDVSFSSSFESYFSITSLIPILLGSGFVVWLQTRVSIKRRFLIATSMMLVIFIITTAFVKVPTRHWVRGFFPITLISLFMLNGFSSINQSSTVGLAGILGRSYIGAMMTGQAVAGIFSASASIIAVSVGPITTGQCESGNVEYSALGYFLSAVVVILICLVSFLIMIRMDFTQYHIKMNSTSQQRKKKEATSDGLKFNGEETKQATKSAETNTRINSEEEAPHSLLQDEEGDDELADLLPSKRKKKKDSQSGSIRGILEVLKEIWVYALSVYLVFVVTLSMFPTVLTNIKSVSYHSDNPEKYPWSDCLFVPFMCFLVFNVSDFVGRTVPQWIVWPKNRYVILVSTLCRVVLIPLLLLCNHKGSHTDNIVFKSDIFPILFNTILGVTNGYLATVCMILAPQSVGSKKAETASTIMSFFLSSGLTTGALLSFVMLVIMGVDIIS